jgi:hypothetical protein
LLQERMAADPREDRLAPGDPREVRGSRP